ncbi:DNA repair protein RecN [Limosilactobacillus fermentum]|uniref:DNA repair protein RecN n=1 Tax=Limosilactobacillus fermentum TaxID=1613 RepID=UPI00019C5FA9|nr:DNA repair protein RecN [Limosilactobacillus fermentum]EEI21290.1 DNA repair protein RecN [Limosilactobacillus fermentum ATCC 14931]MCH5402617.1 DNA repair protein RecN [Limosilactobacillus fermentum]MDC6125453.1 DNA repair protein RecN [Limosilactobacillus fermentum]MDG9734765.1 DNA repair protein RecN [Limosilactobacillus fermentum]QCJ27472.1 DNA repair protein RecN [Limosilactobacillus fermentum]
MLQELTIDNLAIIDHLSLEFDDHMTVLTGETGAGKSIIIDAVSLLAGGRGSQEFIRKGEEKLSLQGQFEIPKLPGYVAKLDELGISHDDGTLIISREIHRSGRNTIRVNGTLVNAATLKQLGSGLVDIQGQNEHQLLLRPEAHLGMLDQFANAKVQPLLASYQEQYQEYRRLEAAVNQKKANEQQWAQRLDMLRYQVKEIGDADLRADEEDELIAERERLEHFQQIATTLQQVVGVLNDDEEAPVLDQVATIMNAAQEIAPFDPEYDDLAQSLSDAYYSLQDVANQAGHQLDSLEFDEERLATINARLATIADLEHKYGESLADVLAYYDQIKEELTDMEAAADSGSDLEERLNAVQADLLNQGNALSQVRQTAARKLAKQVHTQLKELYMDKAVFEVNFAKTKKPVFSATGIDQVEFYIQTNPGEAMGPLARIASGGELSRVMLALKTIFAQGEGVTSIIFDEVDTGVSGRVAQAIADKIRLIAEGSQVLCITHLPQVAAVAQHHLLIQKRVHDQRTTTSVTPLNTNQRVEELARMLAGDTITKLAREHASELLTMAKQKAQD